MAVVTEKAYAKINLGLKILGRRVDGFHDILSVMQTVDLCDTLSLVEKPKEIEVHCSGIEGAPDGEKNLAYNAAALLKKEYNVEKGVSITIQKRISVNERNDREQVWYMPGRFGAGNGVTNVSAKRARKLAAEMYQRYLRDGADPASDCYVSVNDETPIISMCTHSVGG